MQVGTIQATSSRRSGAWTLGAIGLGVSALGMLLGIVLAAGCLASYVLPWEYLADIDVEWFIMSVAVGVLGVGPAGLGVILGIVAVLVGRENIERTRLPLAAIITGSLALVIHLSVAAFMLTR